VNGQVDLRVTPRRDPDRNRLREIVADGATYELRKLVATDRLFIDRGPIYPVTMTITMGLLENVPVVVNVHGTIGGGYDGDGKEVDFQFSDIAFPRSLPEWYFDPRSYGGRNGDAPT
jgi:hypothetical protein